MLALVWENGISACLDGSGRKEKRDLLSVRVGMALKKNAGSAIIILRAAFPEGCVFGISIFHFLEDEFSDCALRQLTQDGQ
jgi:hypothetical protein